MKLSNLTESRGQGYMKELADLNPASGVYPEPRTLRGHCLADAHPETFCTGFKRLRPCRELDPEPAR